MAGRSKLANAGEFLTISDVNGALVGGASARSDRFPWDCGDLPLSGRKGGKSQNDRVETAANSYMDQ